MLKFADPRMAGIPAAAAWLEEVNRRLEEEHERMARELMLYGVTNYPADLLDAGA